MPRLPLVLFILSVLTVPARAVDWTAIAQAAPAMPAAAPVDAPAVICWRTSVLDAFVEAVENNKPLVVLFASDPSHVAANGTNASNEQWAEFNRPEVQALAGQAVFVLCHYDWENGRMRDEYGDRVCRYINITDLPTVVVISPRTDALVETARFERVHSSAELVQGLRDAFARLLGADNVPSQAIGHEVFKASFANPTTPEEAFQCYATAVQNADPYGVARMMIAPYSAQYAGMLNTATELAASKARFQQALNETFGAVAETVGLGIDFDSFRDSLRQYKEVSFQRVVSQTETLATYEIVFEMVDGSRAAEVVEFGREGGVWRIIPPSSQLAGLSNSYDEQANQMKFMAMQLDLVTDQIRRGDLTNREAATTAAVDSCHQSAEIGG